MPTNCAPPIATAAAHATATVQPVRRIGPPIAHSADQGLTGFAKGFGGFSVEETAETVGVSVRTVINDWNTARAWLHHTLAKRGRL